MRLPLPLGKKSDAALSPAVSVERLLNGYVEAAPEGKEPTPVYGTPGFRVFSSGLDGAPRGWTKSLGILYAVCGQRLYRVSAAGVATDLGSVPGVGLCSVASDGTNVVAVSDGEIYVWNGATLGPVTDPDAPDASSVVWVDGFFIFGEKDSQQFFISALADPTNYDALDFSSAEWKPDYLITPALVGRTVYMMGAETIEAQQNTGAADFPFQRYQDMFIDVGIAGAQAYATTNTSMFWLAHDWTARRLDGLAATKINTARIGKIFKSWSDPSQTVVSTHIWLDHLMVVFRNPEGCVVFDQTTELWHERGSYQLASWRVRHGIECYGLQLFGSATEGKIYALDADVFDEDGQPLEFEMVTPYAYAKNARFSVTELEVVAETGVGSAMLDPMITCQKSKDGQTWSAPKRRRLGKQGETTKRVLFGSQGQARDMAFKIRITDPVKRVILGVYADVDPEA